MIFLSSVTLLCLFLLLLVFIYRKLYKPYMTSFTTNFLFKHLEHYTKEKKRFPIWHEVLLLFISFHINEKFISNSKKSIITCFCSFKMIKIGYGCYCSICIYEISRIVIQKKECTRENSMKNPTLKQFMIAYGKIEYI